MWGITLKNRSANHPQPFPIPKAISKTQYPLASFPPPSLPPFPMLRRYACTPAMQGDYYSQKRPKWSAQKDNM